VSKTALCPGRRLVAACLLMLLVSHGYGGESTGVRATKSEALARAFPEAARIERETLFFSKEEQEHLSRMAQDRFESRIYTVYVAYNADEDPLGYAVIDTRTIRTKPATYMIILDARGRVDNVRILAWQEPPEYQPGDRWLAQFGDKGGEDPVRLREDIQAISGATLTSRALSAGVRQVLAVYGLRFAGDS